MKTWTKVLLGALGIGAAVAVAGGMGPKGKTVAEGKYDNKGAIAEWKITEVDGVLAAYIKFPGNPWAQIAAHGGQEQLFTLIDSRMRENGFLPIEESAVHTSPSRAQ